MTDVFSEHRWNLDPAQMLDVMNVGTGINFSIKEAFRTDVREVTLFSTVAIAPLTLVLGTDPQVPVRLPALTVTEGHEDRAERY